MGGGSPQPDRILHARALRCGRWAAAVLAAALGGIVIAHSPVAQVAAQTPLVANGGFEDGPAGWSASGGSLTVDGSLGSVEGVQAAHIVSAVSGPVSLRSNWWSSQPVVAGAEYRLDAWLLDDDPAVTRLVLHLQFVDADGDDLQVETASVALEDGDGPAFRPASGQWSAPAGVAYARVVVEGTVDGPGATFSVDAVALTQVSAPPEVTPTLQPPPPPPAVEPEEPAPVVSRTPTRTPTPTPTRTPTPTPTPTPRPVGVALWNGDFERGVEGWEVRAGTVVVQPSPGGGNRLVLTANGHATAWVEQQVLAAPGGWYEARATLGLGPGAGAGWVRIAWYATEDGSGPQMSTVDSPVLTLGGAAIQIEGAPVEGGPLSTGPVQAPPGAMSARVRILLQPAVDAGAQLHVADVAFLPSLAPTPTPTPTPSATPAPTVAPASTSTPVPSGAIAGSAPGPRGDHLATPPPPAALDAATLAAQRWLRITEVMPDPPQTGSDWEYEWVEVTNLGERAASLRGVALRDRQQSTALPGEPAVTVPPGASVVIAGPRAEVDADIRLGEPIGNGLGNQGDGLELLDGAGQVVDAMDFGSGSREPAPPPGMTVHRWFDAGGALLGTGVGPPGPGVHEPLRAPAVDGAPLEDADPAQAAHEPETLTEAAAAPGASEDRLAWVLLLGVAGGALGGVLTQRLSALRLARSTPGPPAETTETTDG